MKNFIIKRVLALITWARQSLHHNNLLFLNQDSFWCCKIQTIAATIDRWSTRFGEKSEATQTILSYQSH